MRISQIDEKLSIYRKYNVVLWGTGRNCATVYKRFLEEGITVVAFCDSNEDKWGNFLEGKKIISPQELSNIDNLLIQIASSIYDGEIEECIKRLGIDNYISYQEYKIRVEDSYKFYQYFCSHPEEYDYYIQNIVDRTPQQSPMDVWKFFVSDVQKENESIYVLGLPPKTGDWTLNATFKEYNIPHINLWHTWKYMNHSSLYYGKKIKLISAVREPVIQNISALFQVCSQECFWDEDAFWKNGGDVQELFDMFVRKEREINSNFDLYIPKKYYDKFKVLSGIDYLIQEFFEHQFINYMGIDIYKYPFDKEKGYSIIKTDKYDMFIYQLEHMTDCLDSLSEFLGLKNKIVLNVQNDSKNKWYYPYYKNAIQKLNFSEEYLDYCYNCSFMKHFYSEQDIRCYRNKWENR